MFATVVNKQNGYFLINTHGGQVKVVVCIERQTPNLGVVGWIPGLGGYFIWGKNVLKLFFKWISHQVLVKYMLVPVMKQE